VSTPPQSNPPKPDPDESSHSSDETEFPEEESRIVIRNDGTVVIENLTETLAEVAVALNPEDADLSCRLDLGESDDGSSQEESS